MMVRFGLTAFAVALLFSLTGCGTFDNFVPPKGDGLIYGGVRADVAALCNPKDNVAWQPAASASPPYKQLCLLADLPLSAVADTATIPVILSMRMAMGR
jgi:uncharacterized protein YceK